MNWTIIEQYDDWYTDRDGTEAGDECGQVHCTLSSRCTNPLMGKCSATLNNMKLVHCPLTGGLLHLVPLGGDLAGPLLAVQNVTAHPSTERTVYKLR